MNHRTLPVVAFLVLAFVQRVSPHTKPAVELEGAIAKEQVTGDLKAAMTAYQSIASDASAPRDVRAKALLRLAGCYEKLGQQARKVYQQILRDYADLPAAAQARARLASYATQRSTQANELLPQRLTSNTPELTIQAAGLSPNGKLVAYSDQLGIHVRSLADGTTALLPGTQRHLFLRWTGDSNSLQSVVQNAVGDKAMVQVSLSGAPPVALPVAERYLLSPDGNLRVKQSLDSTRLSIQSGQEGPWRDIWIAPDKRTIDQFEWRPNSRAIAVLSLQRGENGYQSASTLELVDTMDQGKSKQVLVDAKQNLFIGAIAWSTARRLLMTINRDTGPNQYESNLWELRFDGPGLPVKGGLRKLTAWKDFPIRAGCLSTDGKRLIFIRSFRQRDVYVAPLEEGGTRMGTPRRLTLDLGDDYPSDWTRDSKAVILTSTRNGPQTLFRQDIDRQTAEQIVQLPGNQVLARVTPDGDSLLFMAMDAAKTPQSLRLMTASVKGGAAQPVPNARNAGIFYRCSAGGVCLDAQKDGDGAYVISELSPTKGIVRAIYQDPAIGHPDISPDGQWIADSAETAEGEAKVVIRSFATGAMVKEIPVPGTAKLFSFGYAPDGKGFFASDTWLTEVRELYIDMSGKSYVLYREPASVFGIWGCPSPDGKYLALVLVTDDSNVYLLDKF
jgi:WD40 repeat protein